jgi:transcriptional regulator with XRE-family HTH domain
MASRKKASAADILAGNLVRLRGERHMSQRDLAAASGARQALISAIELGNANPTLSSLEDIAGGLGVDVAALLAPTDGG